MRTALTLLAFSLALGACAEAERSLEGRQAELSTRASIHRYSQAVAATFPLQEAWVRALRDAARKTEPAALSSDVKAKAIPALSAYRDAVAAMPTETDELAKANASLVATHEALLKGLKAFVADADPKTEAARRRALGDVIATFNVAQKTYRDELGLYYAEHGLELLPSPPLGLDDAP